MIKLLIFDIGDVIVRFSEYDYMHYIAKKRKLSYRKLSRALMPLIAQMELGHLTVKNMEEIIDLKFGLHDSTMEWNEGYKKLARLNEPVRNLVARLSKKYMVVLLTNVSESRYDIMNRSFIRRIPNKRVFTSCHLNLRKPDARIYKRVLTDMKVKPSEAVFVDNMLVNVKGARRVGIKSIQFRNYPQLVSDLKKIKVL